MSASTTASEPATNFSGRAANRLWFTLTAALFMGGGCLSQEAIRRIEGPPGAEGTGITLTRLPEVVAIILTYDATDHQRRVAAERGKQAAAALAESGDEVPPIIAVDTAPDDRLQGSNTIMLWDTQTEEIIGNSVYDVETPPKLGKVAMWETYSAQYVGAGTEP